MKFIISNKEVQEAVSKMGRLLTARVTIPILSGVLVEAIGDCILFTASDGNESIIHRILINNEDGNEILEEGRCVFSRESFGIARKLKGHITFEVNNTMVFVSQSKTKLEFSTMDADEYPKIVVESSQAPLVLSGPVFADMVANTTFSTSDSDSRPILTGVNMSFRTSESVIVATDSHRLSRFIMEGCHHEAEDFTLNVPASILDQAVKAFDLQYDVKILPNKQTIALVNGNTIYISSLLEGLYPDTSRLIPKDFSKNLVVNRKEIIDGLELLQEVSSNSVISLKIDGLFVKLTAIGTGTKGSKELAFETYDGENDFSIAFSAKYVADALKRIDESSVRLRFNGRMNPFVIVSVNDESNVTQLVLPVRQTN